MSCEHPHRLIPVGIASFLMFGNYRIFDRDQKWFNVEPKTINGKKYFVRNDFFREWQKLCNCKCLVSTNVITKVTGWTEYQRNLLLGHLRKYGAYYHRSYYLTDDINEILEKNGLEVIK